jgi:hypothetical protein
MQHLFSIIALSCCLTMATAQNMGVKLPAGTMPNTTLDVNGATSFREGTALTLSNGTNNNISLATEYSFYRIIGPTTAFSVTGFNNGLDGRLLTIVNATTQTMTIAESTGSSSANQILTGSSNFSVPSNGTAMFQYNSALLRWILISTTGTQTIPNNWTLTGNSGTNPSINFIGTTDLQGLTFRTNNAARMHISYTGDIGVGTINPTGRFHLYNTGGASDNTFIVKSTGEIGIGTENPVARIHLADNSSTDDNSFVVTANGEIGLGTSTPSARLHIADISSTIDNSFVVTANGETGIGLSTPSYRLDVDARLGSSGNPLRLRGLNAGATTDSLLTSASGVVRRMAFSQFLGSSAWSTTGNSSTNPSTNFLGTTDAQDLVIKTNNTEGMRMLSSNRYVGLGTSSPTYPLHVTATGSDVWNGGAAFFNATSVVSDKNQTAVHSLVTANPSSASTRHFMGVFGNGISSGSNLSAARISGLYGQANHASASTLSGAIGVSAEIYNTGGGTITNAYGVYVFPSVNSGTITNNYGLYINALTNGTNNYSIYSAGGQSYHAGNFGIATTSVNSNLEVAGSFAANITNTSSNLTLTASHYTVIINNGSTPTITLPAASSCNRRIYVIVNNSTTARTVQVSAGVGWIAFGSSTDNTTSLPASSSITIQSNGTNWFRII